MHRSPSSPPRERTSRKLLVDAGSCSKLLQTAFLAWETTPERHSTSKSGSPTPRLDSLASRRTATRPAIAARFDTLASSTSKGLGARQVRLWKKAAPWRCPPRPRRWSRRPRPGGRRQAGR
eukprot:7560061-Alexandrium_andersonii.AAC.1